jgi:hypothetical protein
VAWEQPVAVITVNCVDGPCKGVQRMDVDSLHILQSDSDKPTPHIYTLSFKLSDDSHSGYPDAYYYTSEAEQT